MRNFPSTLQEFLVRKGKKKLKTFILWPLGEYSFYVKLAGRRTQILLLRLIDINIKYSGVVLRRLWFSRESMGERKKDPLPDQNIFSKNVLLVSSLPAPVHAPALASKALSAFWGAEQQAPTGSTPPPPAWPAGRAKPGRFFFHLAPWQPHSSCAGSRAGRGLSCV